MTSQSRTPSLQLKSTVARRVGTRDCHQPLTNGALLVEWTRNWQLKPGTRGTRPTFVLDNKQSTRRMRDRRPANILRSFTAIPSGVVLPDAMARALSTRKGAAIAPVQNSRGPSSPLLSSQSLTQSEKCMCTIPPDFRIFSALVWSDYAVTSYWNSLLSANVLALSYLWLMCCKLTYMFRIGLHLTVPTSLRGEETERPGTRMGPR